jgi:hypothetical protein
MQASSLDISQLNSSAQYMVLRTFTDFYHNEFREGEILTFLENHFLPYHSGYTIVFREKTLFLQEQENADILNSFGAYCRQMPGP